MKNLAAQKLRWAWKLTAEVLTECLGSSGSAESRLKPASLFWWASKVLGTDGKHLFGIFHLACAGC